MYRLHAGSVRLVDRVWSRAGVQNSTRWYRKCSLPSDGREKPVILLCKKYLVKAAVLVGYLLTEGRAIRLFLFPALGETL